MKDLKALLESHYDLPKHTHAIPHKYPYTKQNAWTELIQFIPNTEPLQGFTPLSQRGNKSTSNLNSPSADSIAVQFPFQTSN